ncbi:hypothetical protein NQ317_003910 [Molorchus minor]|uniref:START domain-containing protein n=1 Tax=Molorchus minor TaxID=1323400 RepID=A0ABQ9IXX7_9CUCU|nr:hypothetical protein NQ317_003910 [Molorchus minor]
MGRSLVHVENYSENKQFSGADSFQSISPNRSERRVNSYNNTPIQEGCSRRRSKVNATVKNSDHNTKETINTNDNYDNLEMETGVVKIAEDSDFNMLKVLVDDHTNWKLEYDKADDIKVWTKLTPNSSFKMVKVQTVFHDIHPNTLFDVLHDPDYRKEWDEHMQASIEIGYLNPNNDVGYYAFWPRSAISHLTGFVIRLYGKGSFLGYVSQTDPRGKLPPWLVNKITQKFAPKVVKQIKKAAEGYECWKASQTDPMFKPWIFPELTLMSPRISISEAAYTDKIHGEVALLLIRSSRHKRVAMPGLRGAKGLEPRAPRFQWDPAGALLLQNVRWTLGPMLVKVP